MSETDDEELREGALYDHAEYLFSAKDDETGEYTYRFDLDGADAPYRWLAEDALDAELPPGWEEAEAEGEHEGMVYYFNERTGESMWEHPLDGW